MKRAAAPKFGTACEPQCLLSEGTSISQRRRHGRQQLSTLQQTGEEAPEVGRGHGTSALGPSDSSDSGSDVTGGPGLARDWGLDRKRSTSDPDAGLAGGTAGPDIGDADLDSDTDSQGTGERAAAGRDATIRDGQDISVDRIVEAGEIGVTDYEPPAEEPV
jgi:hypothetical protein